MKKSRSKEEKLKLIEDFKISISDSQDMLLLKDILKVVTELNV